MNYAARAKGVKSLTKIEDAKKACPEILLPHTDTTRIENGEIIESTLKEKWDNHNAHNEKVNL